MAPDLSGVYKPSSNTQISHSNQQSPNLSRRTSSIMGPPPVPQNSSLPNSPRPPVANVDQTAFAATTGPIRHPRPLTAAELHLELEKEQESIVNRLTRELSALRAQTASVASTTSSTSDLFTSNHNDPYLYPYNAPNIIPTTARRHRSSSNLSSRSARSTRDNLASTAAGATSVSAVAAPRDREHTSHSHQNSSRPSIDIPRPEISRQNSTGAGASASIYRATGSAAASPHWTASHHNSYPYPHPRHSVSSSVSTNANYPASAVPGGSGGGGGGGGGHEGYVRSPSASMSASQAQARYEEAALQRAELEAVKRENEALKTKIRELEKNLAEKATAARAESAEDRDRDDSVGGASLIA